MDDDGRRIEMVGAATTRVTESAEELARRLLSIGVSGGGGFKGAKSIADEYLRVHRDPEQAIRRVIRSHRRTAGATGFVTGLGGLPLLPIAVPADLMATYVQQTRLVATIAHLRGYDIGSQEVRSAVLLTLLGSAASEVLRDVGVDLANRTAQQALQRVPVRVLKKVNQAVGFRLLTRAGSTGVVNLARMLPLAGGAAGAGVNILSTSAVARSACANFPRIDGPPSV